MFPADNPESKGRIERLWQTLQSRLIKATIEVLLDFKFGIRGKYKNKIFGLIPLDEYNREMIETDSLNIPHVLRDFFEKLFFEDTKSA